MKKRGETKPAGARPDLRQRSEALYEEARACPGSDADEIVRALVLAGISRTRGDEAQASIVAERRFHLQRARKTGVRRSLPAGRGPAAERLSVPLIREKQRRLREAAKAIANAANSGRSISDSEIYNRIAAVVGLRIPRPDLLPEDHPDYRPAAEAETDDEENSEL